MKKYIMIGMVLLSGCAAKSYTIDQDNAVYKQIGAAITQQAGYIDVLVNRSFSKEIAACKKEKKGLDLKTLKCIEDPKTGPAVNK